MCYTKYIIQSVPNKSIHYTVPLWRWRYDPLFGSVVGTKACYDSSMVQSSEIRANAKMNAIPTTYGSNLQSKNFVSYVVINTFCDQIWTSWQFFHDSEIGSGEKNKQTKEGKPNYLLWRHREFHLMFLRHETVSRWAVGLQSRAVTYGILFNLRHTPVETLL
jgi:hypothetical protein